MNNLNNESFAEEIVLDATHTGDTYGDPERAIRLAFRTFQARRREEEAEAFEMERENMVTSLRSYWARMAKEAV